MPRIVRYNMNVDYPVFTRMKEKGLSLAAFATTILFLILTVIMVSVTLQSAYAWLVMGSTLFLFVTLCSYSSCEKTYWRRHTNIHSDDSVSTISDGHDNIEGGEYNRNVLPYWITDLPPSYSAATSQQAETVAGRISPYSPPPPYSTVVQRPSRENSVTEEQLQHTSGSIHSCDTLTQPPPCPSRAARSLLQDCSPPERIHSLRIPSSVVRLSQSTCKHYNTVSLSGHPSEQRANKTISDSSSIC